MNLKQLLFFVFLFAISNSYAQIEDKDKDLGYEGEILDTTATYARGVDYSAVITAKGMFSTEDELPFWMSHNKVGRVAPESNISTWFTGKALTYLNLDSFIEAGVGVLYSDGLKNELAIDELYAHYEYKWLQITAGQKHKPIMYNGLSATNQNMLWSLNARPLPGLEIGTNRPVFFTNDNTVLESERKGLGFEATWAEYFMGKDRYMEGAMLHHANLRLVYRFSDQWELKAGIQHFAQWGGSPEGNSSEKRPSSFSDYLKVISGQGGESGLDQNADVIANHLGSYEFFLSRRFTNFRLQFIYNHIFEDSWGMGFGNFPDGRYGLYYEDVQKEKLINSFIVEYYNTRNQRQPGELREYFSHGIYRSGWTYQNRIIGAPFFSAYDDNTGISNNKFTAIHFGLGGRLPFGATREFPYKLMLTYDHREGSWTNWLKPNENIMHSYINATVYNKALKVNVEAGADFGADAGSNFGAGLQLVYEIEPKDF